MIQTTDKKKKIAIALQGGGSHGAFTWGVLDKILESDLFEIEGISGTSAGGMNATALIQGMMQNGAQGARETLATFWHEISELNYFSPIPALNELFKQLPLNPFYFFATSAQTMFSPYQINPANINLLKNFINIFFDFEGLRKYKKMKLFLCATHVKSGKLRIFNLQELSQEVMLASSCLPTLFHAVKINNETYWDGGFVGNPAIYPLIYECQTRDILVIQVTPSYREKIPFTAQEITERHKEITYNACLMREMRSIILITDLIDKGIIQDPNMKRLNMHLIKNEKCFQDLDITSAYNTDLDFLMKLYKQGYKTASSWIKKNYANINKKSTVDLRENFADF